MDLFQKKFHKKFQKNNYLFFIFIIGLLPVSAHSSESKFDIEKGMGQLIFLHDRLTSYEEGDNSLGVAEVFILFKKQYMKNIRHLSEEKRIDYFWSALWHLRFDGHYMGEFLDIVHEDSGSAFLKKLDHFIEKERELDRSISRLEYAIRIRQAFKMIEDRVGPK